MQNIQHICNVSIFFCYVSMGVADGLVSSRHQAISNHYESERSNSQLHQHMDELMQERLNSSLLAKTWLQVPWLLASPRHQQLWYWQSGITTFLFSMGRNFPLPSTFLWEIIEKEDIFSQLNSAWLLQYVGNFVATSFQPSYAPRMKVLSLTDIPVTPW